MANTPDSRTMSWVKLYFVRLMVTRGASRMIPAEPAESDMSPLTRPSRPVVTATGKGRRPPNV